MNETKTKKNSSSFCVLGKYDVNYRKNMFIVSAEFLHNPVKPVNLDILILTDRI